MFSKYRMVWFKYPFVNFTNHDDAGRNPPTPSECQSADCEANELTKKVKDETSGAPGFRLNPFCHRGDPVAIPFYETNTVLSYCMQ